MKSASVKTLMFLKLLTRAKHGTVRLTLPDGKKGSYGHGEPIIFVEVREWSAIDLLFSKGDLGLAEAIIENTIVVDNVAALVEWACRNDQDLGVALHATWYGLLAAKLKHFLNRNDEQGAERIMRTHYNLGNEFYRLWLDPSMTYSAALFTSPNQALQEAQMQKYDRIIEVLDIKAEDHVLEIGCGWGGFFTRAVKKTGCKVTAITNSHEEIRHNRQLIAEKKMEGHVELQLKDYREIEGQFDKIVSIEMIESIGEKNWVPFFEKVGSSLKNGGRAVLQGTTIREDLFYSHRKGTNFIQQYLFPGGTLLTNGIFAEMAPRGGMRLENSFEFGDSYANTISRWRENFAKAYPHVLDMGFDEKFTRLWNLYLCYCEGALRAGSIGVGQFCLIKK